MSEQLKNKFKNGMIPDEVAFAELIDEATKETDLSGYAKAEDIPSIEGLLHEDQAAHDYLSKVEADTTYAKTTDIPDTSNFITSEEIPPFPNLDGFATKDEIPDVSNFITASDIPPFPNLEGFATKEEIPNTENFVEESELSTRLSNYIGKLEAEDFAKKDEIPTLDGLATENYVADNYINKNQQPNFATKDDIPDVSDLATKQEANNRKVDFLRDSNTPPPAKSGDMTKGYKIVHKIDEDNMKVFQCANNGYLHYHFQSHSGGSGYGVNYELMRIRKVDFMPTAMVYKDISTPASGTLTQVWQFNDGGSIENSISMHYRTNSVPNDKRHTGKPSTGLQAFALAAGQEVTYPMVSGRNTVNNLAIFARQGHTDSEEFEILLDGAPVKKSVIESHPLHSLRVFEFNSPRKTGTFEITIRNNSSKNIFLSALNLFDLKNYSGAQVDNYVVLGESEELKKTHAFIDNHGASEYAIKNLEDRRNFGSFHGGEIRNSFKIVYRDHKYSEDGMNKTISQSKKIDWADLPAGEFFITDDFSFQQETTLIERATMYTDTNLNIDGTLHYDMSYNVIDEENPIPLEDFWTSLTCSSPYFNKIKIPKILRLDPNPENAQKSHVNLDSTTNKVIQTTDDETQEIHIRYTRFNEGYAGANFTDLTVSDQPQYRKIYYAPIRFNSDFSVAPKTLQFSKGIDFYTYT